MINTILLHISPCGIQMEPFSSNTYHVPGVIRFFTYHHTIFKNKSGNSRLLVSGMKATGSQFLYVMSDIFLISPYPLTAVYVYDTVIP